MRTRGTRALFWVVALVVAPLVGFVAGLGASGSGSDVLAWLLLLGLPPALTLALGWALRIRRVELVVAGVTATGVCVLYVLVFLWYLFEVVGVS